MTLHTKKFTFVFLPLIFALILCSGCTCCRQDLSETRLENASIDYERLEENIDLPGYYLTLDEIIDIVIRRNLELAVREQEYAIQRETITEAALHMLPELNGTMNWSYRNNSPAATEQVITKTSPPLPESLPATGLQRRVFQWNISLAYNLLTFGLAYFQSVIEFDKAIVSAMLYEKARQDLILNTVTSYWRAIIARKAVEIASPLVMELNRQKLIVEDLLANQIYLSKDKVIPLLNRIYQREIQLKGFNDRTDSSDPTQGYEKEYEEAMLQLSSLMGLIPDVEFALAPVDDFPTKVDFGEILKLERAALINRPELYRYDAEEDGALQTVYQAILQEMPGIQLFYTFSHDDNKFLVNKSWWTVGMQALWNLLSLPIHYEESVIGEKNEELARRNRALSSIGILTQVHLGQILYDQNIEQYTLVKRLADSYENLINVMQAEKDVGKVGHADLLQNQIDAALAKINQLKIYASLQTSVETMNNAIGLPRYFQMRD